MTTPSHSIEEQGDASSVAILTVDTERLAGRVLLVCVLAETALLFLDYHVNYGRATDIGALRRLFNLAREDGLASWLGTTQTILTALTLWLTYRLARAKPTPRWRQAGWLALALFFTYMAIDDGAQLHERLASTVDALTEDSSGLLTSFPSYTWQILFMPLFGALGVFMLVFLWRELPTRASRLVLVSAIGCLSLAVLLDFFEGLEPDHALNLYSYVDDNTDLDLWAGERFDRSAYDTLQHFSRSSEETLEMFAGSLLWFVFLRNLVNVAPGGFQVRLKPRQPT
jgi:hypothetical protein